MLTAWLPVGAIAVAAGWLVVGVVWVALGLDPVHAGDADSVADGGRVAISGGELSHLVGDVAVLAAVAVAVLSGTVLTVHRRRQFSMRDLHPPLIAP